MALTLYASKGVEAPPVREPVARHLCTDCGVSRLEDAKACGQACQFIAPDYPAMEAKVHGRARDPDRPDEMHFGPFRRMVKAALTHPIKGAQWTGIATRLAERLLDSGAVDVVLSVAPDPKDRWKPVPVMITEAAGVEQVRGMRMGYAPLLAMIEPVKAKGYKRVAVIGIPCQVYALRALEDSLQLDKLYVIGTPCSDNTTTERFHDFLALLSDQPDTITYLEFRADYQVELRFEDGRRKEIPFLKLPISKLPPDFFPLTCRTCVDYTNVLADITVGYMGGEGEQWLLVRNDTGEELLGLIAEEASLCTPGSAGQRKSSVTGFISNTERAAGGLPLRGMPDWVRPLVAWLMPKIGPRGLEFARTRVEMKAAETVLHLRRNEQARMKNMVPDHVWTLVEPYGLKPEDGERKSR